MSWGGCPDARCPGVLEPDRSGAAVWPRVFVLLPRDVRVRARIHDVTHAFDRAGEDLVCTVCEVAYTEVIRRPPRRTS